MSSIVIYQDQDDLLYEMSKLEYSSYKKVDCSEFDFDYFLKQNTPTLFKSKTKVVYYDLNHLDSNKLLEFILIDSSNNIFAFTKLDKRTKLYKKLLKDFKIIECNPIKGLSQKKDFIKTILVEISLDLSNLDFLVDILPDNKMIIYNEILKYKEILLLTKDIKLAKKSIGEYQANYDIFELINSLFNLSYKRYYFYLNRVLLDSYPNQVFSLFFKKILYFIYLKIGDIQSARSTIAVGDYFLNKDLKYVSTIDLNLLLSFYKYIETQSDIYSTKDLQIRLLDIYRFFSLNKEY